VVVGRATVGVVEGGLVAVEGTAVVGVELGGATVPGWVVLAGVVGVVVAGGVAGVVAPWTRADAGIGSFRSLPMRLVVIAVDATAGEIAASDANAHTSNTHEAMRVRRRLRLSVRLWETVIACVHVRGWL
jgi:hypothetical protein